MEPQEKAVANVVMGTAFMYSCGYLGALEASLSLIVDSLFGWGAGENCVVHRCTALHRSTPHSP